MNITKHRVATVGVWLPPNYYHLLLSQQHRDTARRLVTQPLIKSLFLFVFLTKYESESFLLRTQRHCYQHSKTQKGSGKNEKPI